ncbi:Uma2 family endonuclease [bacterium]|nr:MAG: Uma2 family endonuclease [bacterium]
MPTISNDLLEAIVLSTDHSLVKLEMADGVPTWEAMPGIRHRRIARSIADSAQRLPQSEADCGCHSFLDVYVRFPDGSFKSPDVAIYCEEPPDVDGAVDILPVAIIEIVSKGYELKDQIGLPFYIAQGIPDVVVYDPRTRKVIHATQTGQAIHTAPIDLAFACGCAVTIPL